MVLGMVQRLQMWPVEWLSERPFIEFWVYRASAYVLLNVVEDPAWLALMFC